MNGRYSDVTGYILAGGSSKRLGRDKRRLRFGGVNLLEHSRRRLADLLGIEPLVAGDNLGAFSLPAGGVIPDARRACGPLGGLVSVLERCSTRWALIIAADLPWLDAGHLRLLLDARDESLDLLTLSTDGRPEPLAALYHQRTAAFWRRRLEDQKLSLVEGIEQLRWRAVRLPAESKALKNINTKKDAEELD